MLAHATRCRILATPVTGLDHIDLDCLPGASHSRRQPARRGRVSPHRAGDRRIDRRADPGSAPPHSSSGRVGSSRHLGPRPISWAGVVRQDNWTGGSRSIGQSGCGILSCVSAPKFSATTRVPIFRLSFAPASASSTNLFQPIRHRQHPRHLQPRHAAFDRPPRVGGHCGRGRFWSTRPAAESSTNKR